MMRNPTQILIKRLSISLHFFAIRWTFHSTFLQTANWTVYELFEADDVAK